MSKAAKITLSASDIERLFIGSDFGGLEITDLGRRSLMVECVLKRASGFHDGYTITNICRMAGLIGLRGDKPTISGMRWMFGQLYNSEKTILERLSE